MAKGLLVRCCLPFSRGNGREQRASASRASHDVREKGKATSVARDEVALIRFRLPPSKSPVMGAIEAKGESVDRFSWKRSTPGWTREAWSICWRLPHWGGLLSCRPRVRHSNGGRTEKGG